MNLNKKPACFCVGEWLTSDTEVVNKWLENASNSISCSYKDEMDLMMALPSCVQDLYHAKGLTNKLKLHSPVEDLLIAILTDAKIYMLFTLMFEQQTRKSIRGVTRLPRWEMAILLLNANMTKAIEYDKDTMVPVPINAIFTLAMATPAGFAAFLNEKINALFKNILKYWGEYLKTEASCYVLTDNPRHGWFGEDAMEAMPEFVETFVCNPSALYYGFTSFDDFFTRKIRPEARPIASPNDDSVIINACESVPYKIQKHVQRRDLFWVKSEPYSIDFILNLNPLSSQFANGCIYQAYLTPTVYHRFHSPVSGSIHDIQLVDGFNYTQRFSDKKEELMNASQGYVAQLASRGIVYIRADNPDIGLMVFLAIGLSDVSTIEFTVGKGDCVKKGDEIGMFHFGGSTYMLIFRPEVQIDFDVRGQTLGVDGDVIKVRSKIATVYPQNNK